MQCLLVLKSLSSKFRYQNINLCPTLFFSLGEKLLGHWAAHLVKFPSLDFGSSHDLMVVELKPCIGLSLTVCSFLGILSLFLSLFPSTARGCARSLSQSK